jgi:hypothetical protein
MGILRHPQSVVNPIPYPSIAATPASCQPIGGGRDAVALDGRYQEHGRIGGQPLHISRDPLDAEIRILLSDGRLFAEHRM